MCECSTFSNVAWSIEFQTQGEVGPPFGSACGPLEMSRVYSARVLGGVVVPDGVTVGPPPPITIRIERRELGSGDRATDVALIR